MTPRPTRLLPLLLLAGCAREVRDTPSMVVDTVDAVAVHRPAIAPDAAAAQPAEPTPVASVALPPDATQPAELPLLVIAYEPAHLEDLNFGDVLRLDPVMGYIGDVVPDSLADADSGYDAMGAPLPWTNRLEWASDADARRMVRDSAAKLGLAARDVWWIVTPSGVVHARAVALRPGREMCGRAAGLAYTLRALSIAPGAYYAVRDSAAAARVRLLETAPGPSGQSLDADGDGTPDTFVGAARLLQRRAAGQVYRVVDLSTGVC